MPRIHGDVPESQISKSMPQAIMIEKAQLAFALIAHKEDTNIKPKNTICLWFD